MATSDPTALIDHIFGDRWRVVRLLGEGPVASVFIAVELQTQRDVAIKVWDRADDDVRAEQVQAIDDATALSHANLLQIIDHGERDGRLWTVSDLCRGGSLASVLATGRSLTPSQALVVTLEAARGLAHAHAMGVAHRNLKPTNVLFTADQRVRLADPGLTVSLGRSRSDDQLEELARVRYASPEQARGRLVTEATDLYSLALIVNEAVTGEPPLVAETVLGTIMDRSESPVSVSEVLGGLRPALERCGRVVADERPEAEELTIALLAAAETMTRPEALPLAGLSVATGDGDVAGRGASDHGDDEGGAVPSLRIVTVEDTAGQELPSDTAMVERESPLLDANDRSLDASSLGEPDSAAGLVLVPDPDVREEPVTSALDELETAQPSFAEPPAESAEGLDVPSASPSARASASAYRSDGEEHDDELPMWPVYVLGALIAAVVAVVLALTTVGAEAAQRVPDLQGLSAEQVASQLGEHDWNVRTVETRLDGSAPDTVVAQDPAAGEELRPGERLTVTISLGNELIEIPSDLAGLTLEQAQARLGEQQLSIGAVAEMASETVDDGLIIGVDEPTRLKPRGDTVSLRISIGPEPRQVPDDVIGLPIGDATLLLTGIRLQAIEEQIYDPDAPVGMVLGAEPLPGTTVEADSPITLFVSAGPEPVEIPDVRELSLAEAVDAIEALGLIFADTEGSPGEPVIETVPPIGTVVDVGAEIVIVLAEGEEGAEGDEADG